MNEIVRILMERDGMSEADATEQLKAAQEDLYELLEADDIDEAYEICGAWFALEPDYIHYLI